MCILVVEDEAAIRELLVEELIASGYEVREAATGDEALAMFETIDPPLKLLVTDIHMPGHTDGAMLGAHIRGHLPHVPVIYTTGRPDALQAMRRLGAQQALVTKPYVPDDIISQIQLLLDDR
jgi:CheY-like chemotaxis protein